MIEAWCDYTSLSGRHCPMRAVDNPNLLVFSRTKPQNSRNKVLVVGNFSIEAQALQIGHYVRMACFSKAA